MSRSRLAAIAALCIPVLPVTAMGGEAPPDRYSSKTGCKTRHTTTRDFVKLRTEVRRVERPSRDRADAAAFVPVEGAKVITRLTDLNLADGNNVLTPKRKKLTNENGVARTRHEFNDFGSYQVNVKVKVDGNVVATDEFKFGVSDRVSGKCDPPLAAQ
jgi:hypothetical protein